jgi:hypothetical protein
MYGAIWDLLAHLKSIQDLHVANFTEMGKERYIAELRIETQKCKDGGGVWGERVVTFRA